MQLQMTMQTQTHIKTYDATAIDNELTSSDCDLDVVVAGVVPNMMWILALLSMFMNMQVWTCDCVLKAMLTTNKEAGSYDGGDGGNQPYDG